LIALQAPGSQCHLTDQFVGAFVVQSSTLVHILVMILGLVILWTILKSMIHVALMNRPDMDVFARLTTRTVHNLVGVRVRSFRNYEETQQTLYWFFGTYILSLIAIYFIGTMVAFAFLYWGVWAVTGWDEAFIAAGSGLTTLGFATPATHIGQWIAIPEGAMGLGLVVFLFTFIPGFQSAISYRDDRTAWLYARLADLRSPAGLFAWFSTHCGSSGNETAVWEAWESWFRLLSDSHSSSPMLVVVPSLKSGQSWIVAAAIVLDTAAFSVSALESSHPESAKLCVRTGTRAVSLIAHALSNTTNKQIDRKCDVSRNSYDMLCAELAARGFSLKPDRDESWAEFVGLRSQYVASIHYLAERAFVPHLHDWFQGRAKAVGRP
jgi:hypothetical protein